MPFDRAAAFLWIGLLIVAFCHFIYNLSVSIL